MHIGCVMTAVVRTSDLWMNFHIVCEVAWIYETKNHKKFKTLENKTFFTDFPQYTVKVINLPLSPQT